MPKIKDPAQRAAERIYRAIEIVMGDNAARLTELRSRERNIRRIATLIRQEYALERAANSLPKPRRNKARQQPP